MTERPDPGLILSSQCDSIWFEEAMKISGMRTHFEIFESAHAFHVALKLCPPDESFKMSRFRHSIQDLFNGDLRKVEAVIDGKISISQLMSAHLREQHDCENCPRSGNCALETIIRIATDDQEKTEAPPASSTSSAVMNCPKCAKPHPLNTECLEIKRAA